MSYFENKSVLVTGGCGFIGSHFIDKLVEHKTGKILVIDNLSTGSTTEYLANDENITFWKKDLREIEHYHNDFIDIDVIVHLAAQPSVPLSVKQPYYDFSNNVIASMKLLEYAKNEGINDFVFAASGGTMYGETETIPTPEDHSLNPISNYGAAKAAFEMYLRSYSELYGIKTTSMRFGNVYGERSTRGVMFDFFHKLKTDLTRLEILGDGKQSKSYLYIDDCVSGFFVAASRQSNKFEAYNMANNPPISVDEIANIVSTELGVNPQYEYTGEDRGWKGDVRKGQLDISKLSSLGWSPEVSIEEGIRRYIIWLKEKYSS